MEHYKNLSGNSGVTAFEIGAQDIKVRFVDGATYLYTYTSAGRDAVEKMKSLARQGRGLSSFISTHVKDQYAAKLKGF